MATTATRDRPSDRPGKTTHWPAQGEWTYEDYARLPDDGNRYEVIEGNVHMRPAPRTRHQRVSFELAVALHLFTKEQELGAIYEAPIDVVLPELASPVQPDILYIPTAQLDIVKEKLIEGAPALIVEVLSPGNPDHDRRTKFHLYARAGVQEYWIVDADSCLVEVFSLRGNAYVPYGRYGPEDVVYSELLPGLQVPVRAFCAVSPGSPEPA